MKKIITFITGLIAICALTACNAKGKEVKAEEFKEQAEKIEEHQYNEATVKYTYASDVKIPNIAPLEGETGPSEDETGSLGEEKKGEAVFTFKDGEWTTTDEEAENIFHGMVGISLKDANLDLDNLTAGMETMSKQYGIDSAVKYYVNPLGVEVSAKGEFKEDGSDGSLDIYEYIAFDKYGYINKLDAKIDIKSVSKIGEESYEMKMFTEVHATISYK